MQNTQVVWSIRRLAKEYNMAPLMIGRLLKSLGAKRLSKRCYCYDSEECRCDQNLE